MRLTSRNSATYPFRVQASGRDPLRECVSCVPCLVFPKGAAGCDPFACWLCAPCWRFGSSEGDRGEWCGVQLSGAPAAKGAIMLIRISYWAPAHVRGALPASLPARHVCRVPFEGRVCRVLTSLNRAFRRGARRGLSRASAV